MAVSLSTAVRESGAVKPSPKVDEGRAEELEEEAELAFLASSSGFIGVKYQCGDVGSKVVAPLLLPIINREESLVEDKSEEERWRE